MMNEVLLLQDLLAQELRSPAETFMDGGWLQHAKVPKNACRKQKKSESNKKRKGNLEQRSQSRMLLPIILCANYSVLNVS